MRFAVAVADRQRSRANLPARRPGADPQLEEILRVGSEVARLRALEVLAALLYSFAPEPELEIVESPPVRATWRIWSSP